MFFACATQRPEPTPSFHCYATRAKPCSDTWRRRARRAYIGRYSCVSRRRTARSRTDRSLTVSRALVCEQPESLRKEGKAPSFSPRTGREPAPIRCAAQDHRRHVGSHVCCGDRRVSEARDRGSANHRTRSARRNFAMTDLPSIDAASVEQFLREQRFRHPATHKNYAGLLCNFNNFLASRGPITSPDVSIVQQWLKEHSLKWQAHILYHRTFLIERYVQWLHDHGLIASNPFAELHRQYGPRTTPIVRALVSEDGNAALQKQRRLPRFGSFLG